MQTKLFIYNLEPELLEAKLNYINHRWGITEKDLISMISNEKALKDLSKNAKRKFIRYLDCLDKGFETLSKTYDIKDNSKENGFLKSYYERIKLVLNDEVKFLRYLTGSWTDKDKDILMAVSIAQKQELVPQRKSESLTYQQPKATFSPCGDYTKYLRR
jgi:succinate dehydrogenase flavin-adding protein (antitoxin of CptAB toxin-antitoxin module)